MDHQYSITAIDKTEYDVINFLLHSYDYVTADEIAAACSISPRSLRARMDSIRERIESYGCTLSAVRSRGYKIPESHSKYLLREAFSRSGPGTDITDGDRTDAIISLLLINDDHYITMNSLADTLYVSRSTINHDLIRVHEKLGAYSLSIEAKARCGLQLKGSEISRRKLLLDRCAASLHDHGEIYLFLDLFLNPENGPEHEIINVIRQSVHLSDLSLADVLLYILIANTRMAHGRFIEEETDDSAIAQAVCEPAAEIIRMIASRGGYEVYPGEISSLAGIIAARQPLYTSARTITEEASRIQKRAVSLIYQQYRFRLDPCFQRSFMLPAISFTLAMLRRPEQLHKIVFKSIRKDFPFPYHLAEATGQAFLEESGMRFTQNVYFYFTAMYRNEIMRLHHPPRHALLVSGYGSLAAENVRFLLERGICFLKITDTCMYSELDDRNLTAYDLIISTIPIYRPMPIPTVNITPFVTNDDLDAVRDKASWVRRGEFIPQMYLRPDLFLSFRDKISLHAAVKETAMRLSDVLEIDTSEQLLYDSIDRASVLSNGIVLAACQGLSRRIPMIFGFAASHPMVMQDQKVYLVLFIADGKYEAEVSAHFGARFRSLTLTDVRQYAETAPDYPHLLDLIDTGQNAI